ncbi:substrate-binding domain-containing protein [Rathayibacter sp. VKM Ac-2760]|uniref:substrate-binding domain-containing protein n=1 Tax=Rathayibacter sp. VKM Ac-2760 TaxID=2609253 RepID=UPI001315BD1E|nr:substrate-binding domain-containing protein [Rathayibacter sp. VKM Ac-2760]QHC58812.1 substrate-binding domain-containing protein [Rathayibacter sp. VKM Ac-2760]
MRATGLLPKPATIAPASRSVVAYNDDVAALVVGAAIRLGLSLPQDLAVVGHDDSPLAQLIVPSLTTVHVDDAGLGQYFAQLALSAAAGAPAPRRDAESRLSVVRRESA